MVKNAMASPDHSRQAKSETLISLGILAVIVITVTCVYLRQFQFNPAVIALRPETQLQMASAYASPSTPIDLTGSEIVPFSPPEHFGPETLYEKINGRADLYLEAGFLSLNAQRLTTQKSSDQFVELLVYDMATPDNAFSVFSMQRREEARDDDMIPNAYHTDNALFMAHGQYYLEILGSTASDQWHAVMGEVARLFINDHGPAASANGPETDLLPADGLKPASLQLIAANAFGHESMDRIYTGNYQIDGVLLTAFLSDRQTDAGAVELAAAYQQALLSFGAAVVDAPVSIANAVVLQFFDTYEIVFAYDRYIAGVHEADNLETAIELARRISKHLEKRIEKE